MSMGRPGKSGESLWIARACGATCGHVSGTKREHTPAIPLFIQVFPPG